jgi:hypothetical protein
MGRYSIEKFGPVEAYVLGEQTRVGVVDGDVGHVSFSLTEAEQLVDQLQRAVRSARHYHSLSTSEKSMFWELKDRLAIQAEMDILQRKLGRLNG